MDVGIQWKYALMWASTRDVHGCGNPLEMRMDVGIHWRCTQMWASTRDVCPHGFSHIQDPLEMRMDVGIPLEHGTPTVATLSKESDSLLYSNNQLPIAPQLGVAPGDQLLHLCWIWAGWIFCRPGSGIHSCFDFMRLRPTSCPQDNISLHSCLSLSYIVSASCS